MRALMASSLFWLGSLAVLYWLTLELGLSGYTEGRADGAKSDVSPISRVYQDRIKELERREGALLQKEQALTEKEKALADQIAKFQIQLQRYESLNADLDRRVKEAINKDEARQNVNERKAKKEEQTRLARQEAEIRQKKVAVEHQARIAQLRGMVEKMEPKKAGKIFDTMDVQLACELIESMKQQRAAEILSQMGVERAQKITQALGAKRSLLSNQVIPLMKPE